MNITRANQGSEQTSRGYALITALIFLVLLTLVALAAIRGSGLEAKMSSNSTERTQAFESAELSRNLIETLIDANTSYGGWPQSIGGNVPTNVFDANAIALLNSGFTLTLEPKIAGDWHTNNSECLGGSGCTAFTPTGTTLTTTGICPGSAPCLAQDASFTKTITTNVTPVTITAELSVYKLVASVAKGSNTQIANGYQGPGKGLGNGGSNLFYYVLSNGHESSNKDATAQTAALYREVIR